MFSKPVTALLKLRLMVKFILNRVENSFINEENADDIFFEKGEKAGNPAVFFLFWKSILLASSDLLSTNVLNLDKS